MPTNNPELLRNNLFDVTGKVALVTGAGTGIGLMIAQALAVNGAKVYMVGRTKERLEQAIKAHPVDQPGQMIPLVGDVTSKTSIEGLVKAIEQNDGHLHILANNAGVAAVPEGPQTGNVSGGIEGPPDSEGKGAQAMKDKMFKPDADFAQWDDIFRSNAASVYFTSVAFLPLLEKSTSLQKGFSGCIINTTSISGMTKQAQNHFGYNSSKAAAISVTTMLAKELASNGVKVRVNSIAPGMFPSEMTAMGSDAETNKSYLAKDTFPEVPAGRPGNDRDMASAALFLATNQYVNGQTIPVDGGILLAY